jgi:hypothetical protein
VFKVGPLPTPLDTYSGEGPLLLLFRKRLTSCPAPHIPGKDHSLFLHIQGKAQTATYSGPGPRPIPTYFSGEGPYCNIFRARLIAYSYIFRGRPILPHIPGKAHSLFLHIQGKPILQHIPGQAHSLFLHIQMRVHCLLFQN